MICSHMTQLKDQEPKELFLCDLIVAFRQLQNLNHSKLSHRGIIKAESGLTAATTDPEKPSEQSHLSFGCCFGTSPFNRVQGTQQNRCLCQGKVERLAQINKACQQIHKLH